MATYLTSIRVRSEERQRSPDWYQRQIRSPRGGEQVDRLTYVGHRELPAPTIAIDRSPIGYGPVEPPTPSLTTDLAIHCGRRMIVVGSSYDAHILPAVDDPSGIRRPR